MKGCFIRFVDGPEGWMRDRKVVICSQEIALRYATAFLREDQQAELVDSGCFGGVSLMELFLSG